MHLVVRLSSLPSRHLAVLSVLTMAAWRFESVGPYERNAFCASRLCLVPARFHVERW